jgi:hypothetical protein
MQPAICPAVLDFLSAHDVYEIERLEIGSSAFAKLRFGFRQLISTLRDSEDEWVQEQVTRMQRLLAEWLTAPVSFQGDASEELLSVLGEVDDLTRTWGEVISSPLNLALEGAAAMTVADSALQIQTRTSMRSLVEAGADFRIYCHRSARQQFLSLLDPDLEDHSTSEERFLHSFRDYRDSRPFDILLKVGPLRTEGWGSSPSALFSAPRYGKLLQIVWAGTADDPRFGVDPVLGDVREILRPQPSSTLELAGGICWKLNIRNLGSMDDRLSEVPADDLSLVSFREIAAFEARRPALLLLLEGGRAVLYPPNATVLVFDPSASADSAVSEAQVNEDVAPGMFLIWPRVQEETSGRMTAAFGGNHFTVWKSILKEELSRDAVGLITRLRAAGLHLTHLESAARHWVRDPTSVIHAPQIRRHFVILMKVLGVDDRRAITAAWHEVAQSRGEAIQAGVQEHSRLIELSIEVLRGMSAEMLEAARAGQDFSLLAPDQSLLFGAFFFMRIEHTEDGYRAPDTELRQITTTDEAAKWLV